MNETKSTVKGLKKQMAAAVAMVCVAAVALGSSTYAWFVSNNSVTATTTSIYAQSNSAYLLIASADKAAGTSSENVTTTAVASEAQNMALYPATWTNDNSVLIDNTKNTSSNWVFATGYAKNPDKQDINDDGLFAIKSDGKTSGSYDAATTEKYAFKNTFKIGTGKYDGSFTNLKVSDITIEQTGQNELSGALRVLVTCGDQWVVAKRNINDTNAAVGTDSGFVIENQSGTEGVIRTAAFGKSATGEGATAGDVQVDVYVYYEGSNERVFSDNLEKINADGVKANVTFTATPSQPGNGAQA